MTSDADSKRTEIEQLVSELGSIDAPRPTGFVEFEEQAQLEEAVRDGDTESLRQLIAVREARRRTGRLVLPFVIILSVLVILLGVAIVVMDQLYRY